MSIVTFSRPASQRILPEHRIRRWTNRHTQINLQANRQTQKLAIKLLKLFNISVATPALWFSGCCDKGATIWHSRSSIMGSGAWTSLTFRDDVNAASWAMGPILVLPRPRQHLFPVNCGGCVTNAKYRKSQPSRTWFTHGWRNAGLPFPQPHSCVTKCTHDNGSSSSSVEVSTVSPKLMKPQSLPIGTPNWNDS